MTPCFSEMDKAPVRTEFEERLENTMKNKHTAAVRRELAELVDQIISSEPKTIEDQARKQIDLGRIQAINDILTGLDDSLMTEYFRGIPGN